MGKTITEKILAKAGGKKEVSPGDYIHVGTSRPINIYTAMVRGEVAEVGAKKLFNPKMVKLGEDHSGATGSPVVAEGRRAVREWAKQMGVPKENVYELGRTGICHVMAAEHCWALPGECYFTAGVDGHTTTLGALGAFAVPHSYGGAAFLVTGRTWIWVPESSKYNITGKLPRGVFARDVFEYVLGQIGGAGAPYHVMEWTGPVIDTMDMAGRFTICCNALFTGAWTAIVNPDKTTIDYVKAHCNEPFEPLVSDPDAKYVKVHNYDVSKLEPQVVPPPKRDTAKSVKEFLGVKINRGFVGSCESGYIEDMRLAAKILKGKKIHPDVVLNVTPATADVYLQCAKEGLLEIFAEAEAIVPPPCCGMCIASNTPLARGDVCISTGTCNYPGREGSTQAEIYLASPATAAASCIEGKIADPRNYL